MRLSLLARKLSVKPSEIIAELPSQGSKPLHGNTKLSEEQIEQVIQFFGPLPEEEIEVLAPIDLPVEEVPAPEMPEPEPEIPDTAAVPEEVSEVLEEVPEVKELITKPKEMVLLEEDEAAETESEDEDETDAPVDEEVIEEEPVPEEAKETQDGTTEELAPVPDADLENLTTPIDQEDESAQQEKVEVHVSELLETEDENLLENPDVLIKAPKVHLPGLTVKGKIDLPEPKPKPEKETSEEDKKEEESTRHNRRGRNRGRKRKDTNPVAAARMREERKAERKKKAEQAREKERKRKFYQENVQTKTTPPKKKPPKKDPQIETVKTKVEPETKLNALQRFWKWMNT